jgi:hypothetical protein
MSNTFCPEYLKELQKELNISRPKEKLTVHIDHNDVVTFETEDGGIAMMMTLKDYEDLLKYEIIK